MKNELAYRHRAIRPEKGKVATVTTANFLQKARHALVPMRKAIIDAFLLTAFIAWFLIITGVLFNYPWLILPIFTLAYLLAAILRLRQAAHETTEAKNPYNYLFH